MSKSLLAATLLIAGLLSPIAANAADKISYPADMLGKWCQVRAEEGWLYFERGSKCTDATLVLKRNGDYVRGTDEHEERCKANPKSYFKGWTEYACTNTHGDTRKRFQKFLTYDGSPDKLGLSDND